MTETSKNLIVTNMAHTKSPQCLSSPPSCQGDTGPNTPESDIHGDVGGFATLVPMNRVARLAMNATARLGSEHHQQFICDTLYDDQPVKAFRFSLSNLPEYVYVGWRIGRGPATDLRLHIDDCQDGASPEEHDVASIHACFNWIKGGNGFYLITDEKAKRKVSINGESFRDGKRLIPESNAISIGECLFSLRYDHRTTEQDEQFHVELREYHWKLYQDKNPLLLSTPNGTNRRVGDWDFCRPIAAGAFGTVFTVVNCRTGAVAAAKQMLRSEKNTINVLKEMQVTKGISSLRHVSLPLLPMK